MNPLVIQKHHKNIQVRSHNLRLKQIISYVVVNVPIHITDVTDIEYLTKMSTTSTYDITHAPTF